MADVCLCIVNIEGKGRDVIECINSMKGKRVCYKNEEETYIKEWKDTICYTFNATVPIPDYVQAQTYDEAGYDAQVDLWGVKWDVLDCATNQLNKIVEECNERMSEYSKYSFILDAPWTPPIKWLETLAKKFPRLTFEVIYEEDGDQLYGRSIYHLGELCESEKYASSSEYNYHVHFKDLETTVDEVYMALYEWIDDIQEEREALLRDFAWFKDKEVLERVIDWYLENIK